MMRNPQRVQIYKAKIDHYWYARCTCGWWKSHRDHQLLRDMLQRHWTWSMRHAANRAANQSLDRFKVGEKIS